MQLMIEKPQADIFLIIVRLLADKALEEGVEYEYIPIALLDPRDAGKHSMPKRGKDSVATTLA